MSWLRIRELVRKEFIQLFRDRRNRPLLIVAPLIQLIVFGYVVTTDVRDIRLGVLDQCRTPESRRLLDAFEGSPTFLITRTLQSRRELEGLLLARKIDQGVIIPPEYSRRVRERRTAEIQVLADGTMSHMASQRIAYTESLLEAYNTRLIREIYPLRLRYGEIEGRTRTWYNPNLDSRYYYVPGIVAFLVMLLSLLFTSMAIVREKEAGTMEQLIVTPLRPLEFILGKTIPFIMIAQGQMIMVILFAVMWFEIPMKGSILLLLAATGVFLLSTLGIGLFISTVSQTQQQAMMTNFFFIVPFFMLSGFVFPISNMPLLVRWTTMLDPLRHLLVIIRGIFLKGTGLEVLWPQFVYLMVIGLVVFSGAVSLFRKRLD